VSRAQERASQVQGAISEADREALERLGATVADACAWFRAHENVEFAVNTVWTARDALVHVLFWHESFARNVGDLAAGVTPRPLKGTYAELGQRAAQESQGCSVSELLARLEHAQRAIEQSVFDPNVTLIPYKVGSRPYTPSEHIRVVDDHVRGHLDRIEAAYRAQGAGVPTTESGGS